MIQNHINLVFLFIASHESMLTTLVTVDSITTETLETEGSEYSCYQNLNFLLT